MASITSTGLGSGLDVEKIITDLMALEKKPLTSLQTKASTIDSKISAFGTVKSQLSTLSDAVTTLSKASTWTAKTVSSSNAAAVSATVANGTNASVSSFSVSVSKLARTQSISSAAVANGATVGSGTLTFSVGTWSDGAAPAFTPGAAAAVSVDIAATDTMADIASKINKAGAGVTATVLKDISGDRLMMRSSVTGEAAGFRVTASADSAGLDGLTFDDPAAGAGMAANTIQYGQNAKAAINGVEIESASNTLDETLPGLTLTLSQVTTSAVEITATNDTSGMRTAINSFVTAYNAMNQMFNSATKYDPATKTAALLQGDATTTGLQAALRSLVGAPSGRGALMYLSDVGVSIARDGAGNLSVDTAKLDKALKTPDALKQFFATEAGADASATGFGTRLAAFTQAAIGADGVLTGKTDALDVLKKANTKDQERVSDRLSLTEARLRKQYTALDTQMSKLTALNTYVAQQIAQWNKSTG